MQPLVAEMLGAIRADATAGLLIEMVEGGRHVAREAERQAAREAYRRQCDEVRAEAKAVEAEARSCCLRAAREGEPFVCPSTDPCGFGDCRWAWPLYAAVVVGDRGLKGRRRRVRPVPSVHREYWPDHAVAALLEERGLAGV